MGFTVERSRASAADFHARPLPEPMGAAIWVHEVTGPALVLGSTQRRATVADRVACEAAGVEVVVRRSGGGAVLLRPNEVTWVDVLLPTGGPGWSDDVHRPMVWLGERLAAAFAQAGVVGAQVHRGPMVETPHSRSICFDGLGPGELTLDGAKLVGISQRRVRVGARLQCCWYSAYDPAELATLLVSPPAVAELRPVATVDAARASAVVDGLVVALNAALAAH